MKKSKDLYISPSYSFQDNAPVYLFTNENVADEVRVLGDIYGGRVLSVGASGDHAFAAYMAGAAHVDTFDINSLQQAVTDLKTTLIHHVSYENFMDFFFDTKNFFNPRILMQRDIIIPNTVKVLLAEYERRGNAVFKYEAGQNAAYLTNHIPYLVNKHAYMQLRSVLPKQIGFTHCDMRDIQSPLSKGPGMFSDNKYDVILLSNIYDYVVPSENMISQTDNMKFFYDEFLLPMSRRLLTRNGGRIAFRYLWGSSPSAWSNYIQWVENEMLGNCARTIRKHSVHVRSFPSNQKGCAWDSVLFLKQR
ncbi:MAG: DUF3419 family protein [Alphaproteobacteria bacterium]|nr:DUF3419 family protein [Alphaproteobacteria bacterium]